jgi:predicted DNA-binding protein
MPENAEMTTAETLSIFYRELINAGLPDMLVHELVTDAGRRLLNGEISLAVKAVSHV